MFQEDFEGAFKLIDDNYAEKAHFIYELLQNADDVKATEVTFILTTDGLLYKHNGENRFSIKYLSKINYIMWNGHPARHRLEACATIE